MTEETVTTPGQNAPAADTEKKVNRLVLTGKVVSDKMDKTIVVEVEYLKKHRLYKKSIRRHARFKAHDENNDCKVGDLVRIEESRPISKEKHWRLLEIVQKGVEL
ncbi:MAG TPA: 30S ribosomal protein S17 [Chloroflexia bacterium]|nr:30S ribosomal protein S17 [Chloroflexia bacterium]